MGAIPQGDRARVLAPRVHARLSPVVPGDVPAVIEAAGGRDDLRPLAGVGREVRRGLPDDLEPLDAEGRAGAVAGTICNHAVFASAWLATSPFQVLPIAKIVRVGKPKGKRHPP